MRIEEFKNITVAYIRHTGDYGPENEKLMKDFKELLKANHLFNEETTILGIALDNPATTPREALRYDVGLLINKETPVSLKTRQIADGRYAIYEAAHTKQGVVDFWQSLPKLAASLPVDENKPIIERYRVDKVAKHLCEFCIPLKR